MASDEPHATKPDLGLGVPIDQIPVGGLLTGRVEDRTVVLARLADGFRAIDGECTHYGGPLGDGLLVGDEVRCPWHHACFSLRTGAALKAPAFSGLGTWRIEVIDGHVFVRDRLEPQAGPQPQLASPGTELPDRIVIVGAGAAGFATALRLRELGYQGLITMLSQDEAAPYDRPNLSKDYLAGTAPAEWIPLREDNFYPEQGIELHTGCEVTSLDPSGQVVRTADGREFGYDRLVLATGAVPRPVPIPGFDHPNVLMLRSLADSDAIIERCAQASKVILLGAGFIGMETASALRERGLAVEVLELAEVPLQRVVGDELGRWLVRLHQSHGVVFRLGVKVAQYDGAAVVLDDGTRLDCDFVIAGIGVVPATNLAEDAGLAVDKGIVVDNRLQTSVPGIYAVGDVARYPRRVRVLGQETARIEHWVHAQRQGQAVAANLLGADAPYTEVPFFWTHQHGMELRYCGHGAGWDEVKIDGDLDGLDFTARYYRDGDLVAAASVGRDLENLQIEEELRRQQR